MPKYNFYELEKHHPKAWAVLRAISAALDKNSNIDPERVHIIMTVNGVEVDFLGVVDMYTDNLAELVEARARAMLHDRVRGVIGTLDTLDAIADDLLDEVHEGLYGHD